MTRSAWKPWAPIVLLAALGCGTLEEDGDILAPGADLTAALFNESRARVRFIWGNGQDVELAPGTDTEVIMSRPGYLEQVFFNADPLEFVAVPANVGCIFRGFEFRVVYYGSRMTCEDVK